MEKSTNVKKVILNFLQSGHSLMTADSVHRVTEATILKKLYMHHLNGTT